MTWFLLVIFYGKIEVFSSLTVENKSKLKINRNFLLVRSCIGFMSGKDANFSLVVKMQTFLLLSRCKLFSCCQDANISLGLVKHMQEPQLNPCSSTVRVPVSVVA